MTMRTWRIRVGLQKSKEIASDFHAHAGQMIGAVRSWSTHCECEGRADSDHLQRLISPSHLLS